MNIYDGAFLQKWFFADVWLGFNYASGSLDAQCEMVPLNILILYYCVITITSSYFVFENENITMKNIWLPVSQDSRSTPLIGHYFLI